MVVNIRTRLINFDKLPTVSIYFCIIKVCNQYNDTLHKKIINNRANLKTLHLNFRADETLRSQLLTAAAGVIGEVGANQIGDAAKLGDINSAAQYIAHAALGCGVGALGGGNCASGATGAVIGEVAGELYKFMTPGERSQAELEGTFAEWKQKGVDIAKLSAALGAFVAGLDVNSAAATGANSAENNAFAHIGLSITIPAALAKLLGMAAEQLDGRDHSVTGTGISGGLVVQFPSIWDLYSGYGVVPFDVGVFGSVAASPVDMTLPTGEIAQGSLDLGGGLGWIHGNFDGSSTNFTGMLGPMGVTGSISQDAGGNSHLSEVTLHWGEGYGVQIDQSITGAYTIRDAISDLETE
jgi:hypothetical protein